MSGTRCPKKVWVRVRWALVLLACIQLPAHAADLMEVYRQAKDSDPTFQSAHYTLTAAQQKVPQAISALLPAVGVTANEGRTQGHTDYTGTLPVQRGFNSYAWTLQLTQPVLRAQNIVAYEKSQSLADQATAQFAQAGEDLMTRVAQAYFDVLIAEEGLSAAEAQLTATHEQLAATRRGFEYGTTTITDVHEAQAKADLALSQRAAALDEIETKRAELEKITGTAPSSLASLKAEGVMPSPDPADVAVWVARAKVENPAVRAQIAAVEAAKSEVSRVSYQRLPTLDLVASIGRNYSSGNITNPQDYGARVEDRQIGLQLSMPIVDGGGMHAQVLEAEANQAKAEADLEAARRQSAAQVRAAYSGIVSGLVKIKALESAVTSGDSSVMGNQKGYTLGIRINSDVLGAQQQLYATRRDLAKARCDTLLQGLKLKAAAGILSETDLLALNGLLVETNSIESALPDESVSVTDRTMLSIPEPSSDTQGAATDPAPTVVEHNVP